MFCFLDSSCSIDHNVYFKVTRAYADARGSLTRAKCGVLESTVGMARRWAHQQACLTVDLTIDPFVHLDSQEERSPWAGPPSR
jgi:hypothetical protein